MSSDLLFAPYAPKTLEPKDSIGAKWLRMLEAMPLEDVVADKRVAVKMHLGGGTGFTTIHPFFVRKLIARIRACGARDVFVTDSPGAVRNAVDRGYTGETLGCNLLPVAGGTDNYFETVAVDPPFLTLDELELAGEVVAADALIDLAHVKGHGCCGFGGASKNLSMGCVTGRTRGKLHGLEGGLDWDEEKCTHCTACIENCPNEAMRFNDKNELAVNFHNCKYCQHCALICPEDAITMKGGQYKDFQKGMAIATSKVLATFEPAQTWFINMLTDITLFCDCWGMTTPTLVPDIGILAGRDIVAIEQASLDMIQTENLIPGALPPGWHVRDGDGHLFDRVHGKDPYVVIDYLHELGHGAREYSLNPID